MNALLKHIKKYKYNGIHFHLHGLYVFTEEQLINLLNEIKDYLREEKR